MKMKLGEALVKDSLITREQLRMALERQVIFGGRIGTNIVELGFLKEGELSAFLSQFFGVPAVNPKDLAAIDSEVIACFSRELAEKYRGIPFRKDRKRLHVAMSEPRSHKDLDDMRFTTGFDVIPYIITELRLIFALEKYYGTERDLRYISTFQADDEVKTTDAENKEKLMKLKEEFAAARNKDEIIGLLLLAASKVYSRVGLFVLKDKQLKGWKSKGMEIENKNLGVAADSVFFEAISKKSYYRGPVLKVPGNEALISILAGAPQDCLVIPVLIRDKVIALMYIDNGNASVLDAGLSYINKIVSIASLSFEMAILRSKIMDL
ncbi:MAG: hypothetical protein EPN25_08035 [Nitrospirae bacterium]|nr:MAG: hypothetical protein EPN25_08035 [Nitrospirota bacterium]